ncbi:MAG: hypothetical protein IJM36_02330 [Acholeplasmatales bacterium]|nr:hypothetical protein [Acholeplasmatales bacterium]
MEDNTIFDDYAAWKKENHDLIYSLVNNKSKIIQRFSSVIAVVDYLYDYHLDNNLSEDEELIFSSGYDYIYDQFQLIETLLENNYNNDVKKMEKYGQTINLLLYINDFKLEIANSNLKGKEVNQLNDLNDKVYEYIEKNENAPDEYFQVLNDLTSSLFEKNDIEIQTIDQIFYEIAIEYDIYDENEYNIYNYFLNKEIEKRKNVS